MRVVLNCIEISVSSIRAVGPILSLEFVSGNLISLCAEAHVLKYFVWLDGLLCDGMNAGPVCCLCIV